MPNIDELKLHYRNLPKLWANYNRAMFSISEDKLSNLKAKLLSVVESNKQINLYVQEGCGLLVKETYKEISYSGLDFKDYFDKTFSKSEDNSVSFDSRASVIVIYNVGLEKALNTEFSAKLLLGLIKQAQDLNKVVMLSSHLRYNDFYKKYQIEFINKLTISKKQEEKIF